MITIERSTSQLEKQSWVFTFHNYRVYLESYTVIKRQSTRHGWKPDNSQRFLRLFQRDSTLSFESVPKPDDVLAEVNQRVFEIISVGWGR